MNNNDLCEYEYFELGKRLQFNISEEAQAIEYYYELLKILPEKYRSIINEIISDELDHSIKLGRIAEQIMQDYPSEYQSLLSLKERKGE